MFCFGNVDYNQGNGTTYLLYAVSGSILKQSVWTILLLSSSCFSLERYLIATLCNNIPQCEMPPMRFPAFLSSNFPPLPFSLSSGFDWDMYWLCRAIICRKQRWRTLDLTEGYGLYTARLNEWRCRHFEVIVHACKDQQLKQGQTMINALQGPSRRDWTLPWCDGPALRTDDSVRHASVLRSGSVRHMVPAFSGISKSVLKPRHPVYLAAFNVRTLKQAGQQAALALTLDSLGIDVCCLSNENSRCKHISNRFRLRTSGDPEAAAVGCAGVGIVLSHWAEVSLLDWIPVDSRLCANANQSESSTLTRRFSPPHGHSGTTLCPAPEAALVGTCVTYASFAEESTVFHAQFGVA
ncbi:hypothetical protein T265_02443 [Opisthorchis viverrini]|uniref:Uncharacterized protein n=1 Tax=Opisthorchis viverrini TaxID=6198 RepID=A0A075A6J0_OPIVI|nr:hypothetical protein T265_02443 [Opisthorchis viverrini]KER31250.1 hypothetical protein T265_02443 [Opisthorchis viverrini]